MKYLFIILLGTIIMSCNRSQSGKRITGIKVVDAHVRAKVLENNTITHIKLDSVQCKVYRYYDTVWVNMSTHTIDDTSDYTMKCVILR